LVILGDSCRRRSTRATKKWNYLEGPFLRRLEVCRRPSSSFPESICSEGRALREFHGGKRANAGMKCNTWLEGFRETIGCKQRVMVAMVVTPFEAQSRQN